jgi:hypothetical protein
MTPRASGATESFTILAAFPRFLRMVEDAVFRPGTGFVQ